MPRTPTNYEEYGPSKPAGPTTMIPVVGPTVKAPPKKPATKTPAKPVGSGTKPKVTSVKPPARTAPGPVKPIIPTLDQFLAGDVDYKGQIANFDRTLSDFLANVTERKTRLGTEFGEGKRNADQQRERDLVDIKNDFASRGLLNSGGYIDKLGMYEQDFARQLAEAERMYNQSVQDVGTEETQFRREQELQKQAAMSEAARRRAEKYGVTG